MSIQPSNVKGYQKHRQFGRTMRLAAWLLTAALAVALSSCSSLLPKDETKPAAGSAPIELQLLSLTDFHGYLQPTADKNNGQLVTPEGQLRVGGATYVAAHLKKLKAERGQGHSMLLSVGDNFSGWPFEVEAFKNEPTIEFLNKIGVEASVAGNHEFDISADFLTQHMMKGQCFDTADADSCYKNSAGKPFSGAAFEYLSANIRDVLTNQLVLKPYVIKNVPDGRGGTIPVGIIGLTEAAALTKEPLSVQIGVLAADAAPELKAGMPSDPAARALVEPANRYAKELQDQGVQSIILLLHEGAKQSGPYNGCLNPTGPAIDFAKYASPAIDVILTGHWHEAFNCMINDPAGNPRPVMEGGFHGKLITEVNLKIDAASKDVIREQTIANNRPVTRDLTPDPEIANLVSYWVQRAKEKWAEPLAKLSGDLPRTRNASGESALSDVIADAFYASGQADRPNPADLALTSGDPKRDLTYAKGQNAGDRDGMITFGELFDAYGTQISQVNVSFTGEQIVRILEEQWKKKPDGTEAFNPLNVSHNVRYVYDRTKPIGQRIDPSRLFVNDKPVDPKKSYRVATTGLLVVSGAATYPTFAGYASAKRVASWPVADYLKKQGLVNIPELNRIRPVNP
ncbi:bifunctional metallophosphatase/5'-nucleotidase [Paenibacillus allorhizosphaerae]|uniref:Endonuclease YhcR n=1 Tax=Paenibacillus allorhizosphaerae TaxID=2849866 RepID=A0ABM8VMV2_9BACL|nr:bifunctional UDP-sugar hydrolase/5'-nucleotidase [Paenibacillus allorhizosphaerae]CAG7650589.1 Endonuclease YhcR [Paenibacillus allorhizosphaerae]